MTSLIVQASSSSVIAMNALKAHDEAIRPFPNLSGRNRLLRRFAPRNDKGDLYYQTD